LSQDGWIFADAILSVVCGRVVFKVSPPWGGDEFILQGCCAAMAAQHP
jgi:hypothetical protein